MSAVRRSSALNDIFQALARTALLIDLYVPAAGLATVVRQPRLQ